MFVDRSETTPFHFYIRLHALGVVISRTLKQTGELVLPGEECFGMDFATLEELARVWGHGTVPGSAVSGSPLDRRKGSEIVVPSLSTASPVIRT